MLEAFSEYGAVRSVVIVRNKYSGESEGFAFIDMPDAEDAARAIAELNGRALKGRSIRVTEATNAPISSMTGLGSGRSGVFGTGKK